MNLPFAPRCGRALLALALGLCAAVSSALAQATGSISGTVANQATSQFLANAEVKISGTNLKDLTDRDGSFELRNLAPGTYELEVNYAGLDTEKRSVTVTAGQTSKQEFNLTTGVYKMAAFTVASEAEGNAAQVNKQKKADFFVTAVSADTLGEVPEGNIGEFLKYVPGLQVNYVNADASTVSVRGQDPESTLFMIDGQAPAAAGTPPRSSTGSSDASSRAFEFTQASITNIESIEVYKAPPPWMAPSTGGVINAETKNAFAQKGRVFRVALTLSSNTDMMHFGVREGPGQRSTWRIKPGGSLSYSEAFLNNTLGVTFTYSESHLINPTHNNAMGYTLLTAGTTAAPATDASPVRVDTFTLVDGPEVKHRRNMTLGLDYKLGPQTSAKFTTTYNTFLRQSRQHTYRLRPIAGTTGSTVVLSATPDRDVTVNNGQVDVFADYSDAYSPNINFAGSIRHKWGRYQFDGAASFGKSDSKTVDLPEFINSVQFNLLPNRGVGYRIQASPDLPAPTALTQTAGPDWFDLASYDQRSLSVQTQPRFQNDRVYNLKGDLRASFAEWRFPIEFRTGAGFYKISRRKAAGQIVLDFRGADGVVGNDDFLNATAFADTTYGDSFLYGIRTPPLLDPYKVGAYMKQNPLAFQDIQPTNVQRQAVNTQSLTQIITSAYFADTVRFSNKFSLLTGIRGEKTENFARGANRINSLGNGLVVNSKPWFQAVYSQTKKVTADYTDYFPQAQATYRFTPDLILRASWAKAMSRPPLQTILPNTTINDTATVPNITVNNNALLPTYSNNLDVAIELYTANAGKFTAGWFKKKITNYIINETVVLGAGNEFGESYTGYNLNTQDNGGTGRFEGVELSVQQPLKPYLRFAPESLQGFDVFGNYTKNYKGEAPNRNGVITTPTAPNFYLWNANYGVGYRTPRGTLYAQIRTVIYPSAVSTYANGTTDLRNTYEARHQRWDFTLRYRMSRNYAVELTGSNVFEDPSRKFIQGGRVTQQRDYGANYVLSFTANLDQLRLPFINR